MVKKSNVISLVLFSFMACQSVVSAQMLNEKSNGGLLTASLIPARTLLIGESMIPAVFVYHCQSVPPDPEVQICVEDPVYGGVENYHIVHTWVQIVNSSNHTFNSQNFSDLRLYIYGKDGQQAQMDSQCASDHYYESGGYINLLDHTDDGEYSPGEAIFLYLNYCMNDAADEDFNPPMYVKLYAKTTISRLDSEEITLTFHAGVEESAERPNGKYSSKAVVLLDKEILSIEPVELVQTD